MTVRDNPAKRRYEALVDGEVAGCVFYAERDGALVLLHTEVADEYEGKGVGSRLVAATLDDVRARGLSVVPRCPFAKGYIERHPEYADLVDAGAGR
ncbi:MAG TPA: GNAT family N-acetyltransferase [Gaiellaceae bacterium]|nr:GNAT family N-acetyltransferase [Gaiellaceae bacterium]